MNTRFKEQMFDALSEEISSGSLEPESKGRGRQRSVYAAVVTVAAVAVVVVALGAIDRGGETVVQSDAQVGQVDDTASSEPSAVDTELFRDGPRYTFGQPSGTVYRVPAQWADAVTGPFEEPNVPKGTVGFQLAEKDDRLNGMLVTPAVDPPGTIFRPVETIGSREITTLAEVTYPLGMDDSTSTGPYFWVEADGSEWTTTGTLDDLRAALPRLDYVDGEMVLGEGLEPWDPPSPRSTPETSRIRDATFELTVTNDTDTDFELVDPNAGSYELVEVNGNPGAFSYGGSLQWRVDESTVLSVSGSLKDPWSVPQLDNSQLLAAASAARLATDAEFDAMPIWRGADTERVVVKVPADLPLQVELDPASVPQEMLDTFGDNFPAMSSPAGILLVDLDDEFEFVVNVGPTWATVGHALPLGPETIGHRIQLFLVPASPTFGDQDAIVSARSGCSQTVVVPPEGSPPVVVEVEAEC